MTSSSSSPTWSLQNQGSFASVHVILPPRTKIHCESDAVVTFSQGIEVTGTLENSFVSSLMKQFLARESFFTTVVTNVHPTLSGDVMMAAADPGGMELHTLHPGEDLFLTAGAYVASDHTVSITTAVQTQWSNSMLSGTGLFLLRASGHGKVACAAYGSIHKYQLKPGEWRSVDNGHLVAWTSHLPYRVGLANPGGIMASIKSGEGIMCHFGPGPGIVYVQSHKPGQPETIIKHSKHKAKTAVQGTFVAICLVLPVLLILMAIIVSIALQSNTILPTNDSFSSSSSYEPTYSHNTNQKTHRPTTSQRRYRAVGEF